MRKLLQQMLERTWPPGSGGRLLLTAFALSIYSVAFAQTTLVQIGAGGPTSSGGFENAAPTGTPATDFTANNWTVVNQGVNNWNIGTAGAPAAGTYHAFQGPDGSTFATNATASWCHLYRDVTIPAGQSILTVSFRAKFTGGTDCATPPTIWDAIEVRSAPTSLTPAANAQFTGIGTAQVGLTCATSSYANYSFSSSVTPGTSVRICISARNDGFAPHTAFALDDILVQSSAPATFTATAQGGLWNSPGTWVGGVVPGSGNDIDIPAGSTVMVNQVNTYRNLSVSGNLLWNGTFTQTYTGNVTVNAGGSINLLSTGLVGQQIDIAGNLINNGTIDALFGILNFNGTGNSEISGSGAFVSVGGRGVIRSLFAQNSGNFTLNQSQNITVTGTLINTCNNFITNGKSRVDNAVDFITDRVFLMGITAMGSGYTTAPSLAASGAQVWAAGATIAGAVRVNAGHQYVSLDAIASTTAPTHTSFNVVATGAETKLWLHIGPVGTIGSAFGSVFVPTINQQYVYNDRIYTVVTVGTMTGAQIQSAMPISTTVGTAVTIGTNVFRCVGTAVSATLNHDAVNGVVRSATIVSSGTGVSASPGGAIVGGGGAGATFFTFYSNGLVGPANSTATKATASIFTGALDARHSTVPAGTVGNGVYSATPGASNRGWYNALPSVGFSAPPIANLVTAQGSSYTSAPTVSVAGGTLVPSTGTAIAGTDFQVNVAGGRVVSVYYTGAAKTYSVPPTISLTGGGGAGATISWGTSWPTATVVLSAGTSGQVTGITITNNGYGYVTAPTMAFSTNAAGEAPATVPTCRLQQINLRWGFFSPQSTNPNNNSVMAMVPSNNRINGFVVTSGAQTFTSNIEATAAAPLGTFTGVIDMGGSNKLTFSHPDYAGTAGTVNARVDNGTVVLSLRGGNTTSASRTFPIGGGAGATSQFVHVTGAGTVSTGFTYTSVEVTRFNTPSGTVNGGGNITGLRGVRMVLNGPAAPFVNTNTGRSVQMFYNTLDNLVSDNASLFLAESSASTGNWTRISTAGTAGSLAASGNRASQTVSPYYTVATTQFYAWVNFGFTVPPGIAYNLSRSTGNTYTSIAPIAKGGDGTGLSLTGWVTSLTNDEEQATITLPVGWAGTFQGSAVTGVRVHTNGFLQIINGTINFPANPWDNNMALNTAPNVVAAFWEDLVNKTGVPNGRDNSIQYTITGSAPNRILTVEWSDFSVFGAATAASLNFQIQLLEDGRIRVNYGDNMLFNGTTERRYSYSVGVKGSYSANYPTAGQVFAQQYENYNLFGHERTQLAHVGANGLAVSPEPRSRFEFTPGAGYSPPAIPASPAPANDGPGAPEAITALSVFPSTVRGLAWNEPDAKSRIYSTRFATNAGTPGLTCGPSGASDVWFRFQAKPNETDVTVRIYPSGGFIPRITVYPDDLSSIINCSVGAQGAATDAVLTGLTAGNFYMVRVSHDRVGTSATFSATSVSSGGVSGVSITSGGSGYTTATATFNGPLGTRMNATGGGGVSFVGAVNAVTSEQVTGGSFDGGNDYSSVPTLSVESPNWGVTGDFAIVVYAPPVNDNSAGAIALTSVNTGTCTPGANQRTGVSTSSATQSPEAIGTCALGVDDDLWYKFVATGVNSVISVQSSAGFDAAMQIWDAGVAGNPAIKSVVSTPASGCVNAAGAGVLETVSLTTIVGNTYFIRVYHVGAGFGGAGANFSICVTTPVPACATPNTPLASSTTCATPSTIIDWQITQFATAYDVYLDAGAGPATTLVSADLVASTYDAGLLAPGPYTYRIVPKNGNGSATSCSNISFTVASASPTGTTPGTRCGIGTVTLNATASAGQTLRWFAAASGGTALASGPSPLAYTTPSISTTTNYYVSAANAITANIELGTTAATSNTSGVTPYTSFWTSQRTQYLVRASELIGAGLVAGNLTQLSFNVTTAAGSVTNMSIKLAVTNSTVLSGAFLTETFTSVFSTPSYTPVLGLNTHVFTTPFNWNGVDNLLVEICNDNNPFTTSSTVATTPVGYQAVYGQYEDNVVICSGGIATGSNTSTSRPDMVFRGQALCAGPRVAVAANVTAPPALTLSTASVVVCEGGTSANVGLTSPNGNFATYTWSPSSAVTGNAVSGWTFNPSGSTAYVLTATGTGASPCVNQALLSALVRPNPAAGTASIVGAPPVCEGTAVNLNSTGLTLPTTIFSQNWESGLLGSWTRVNNTTGGTNPAGARFKIVSHGYGTSSGRTVSSPGDTKFIIAEADTVGSGAVVESILISPVFSLDGYTTASLAFRHYLDWLSNSSTVEISTDGGATYQTTPLVSYTADQGTVGNFASANLSLNAFVGQNNLRIRFRYRGGWDWEWAIDDIALTGTPPAVSYAWTGPNAFTATGQNTTVSDLEVASSGTYTVTATTPAGCFTTATTSALTVVPRPTVKFVGNDFVCQGQTAPVDIEFTGTQPWNLTYTIDGGAGINLNGQTASPVPISYVNATVTRNYVATTLTDASGCSVLPSGLGTLQIQVPNPCQITWDGSQGNGSWTDADNWTPNNSAPSQQTSVIIPNVSSLPVIGNAVTANCADLFLTGASNITVNTGGNLNIRGSVNSSNALVSGLGLVNFSGTGAQGITGTFTLNNVNFNNTVGGVVLNAGSRLVVNPTASTGSGIVTFVANSKLTGSGTLVLASNATATAKIGTIPSPGTVTISAPVEMQRWLPWSAGEGAWYLLGSPISGRNFTDLADDYTVTGLIGGFGDQGGDVQQALEPERVSIFKHVEAQHPVRLDTVQKRGWRAPGNENILPGVGYRAYVRYYTNPSHRFDNVGTIVKGNVAMPTLTRTHFNPCAPSSPSVSAEICDEGVRGYNLVANPYPCDIDWASTTPGAINKTGIINGFATWNAVQGGYRYYEGTGGSALGTTISTNPNPSVIGSSQAFWVRVAGSSTTTVSTFSMTEDAKTTISPATYTRVASVLSNNLRVTVANLSDNDGYNYTGAVWFSENGSDGFDGDFDVPSMSSSRVYLGFNVADEFMVRSALSPLTEYRVVPMVVKYQGQSGNFRFSFDDLSSFEATTEIYLRDNYLGILHNVAAGDYTFYAGSVAGSNASDRFELVFSPNSVTGSAGMIKGAAMVVMPNPGDQRSSSSVEISGIEAASGNFDVTDALGRVLFTSTVLLDKGAARLQVPADLAAGVYTLKFVGGNKQIQKKFVVR